MTSDYYHKQQPLSYSHEYNAKVTNRIEAVVCDNNLRSCLSGPGGFGELGGTRETRRDSRVLDSRKIRVGSWNVGLLTEKSLELADALERHRVDIACFQETKWKGSSNREGNRHKLWYSGATGPGPREISAYAPQVSLSEEEKKTFWDYLDESVREFSTDQRLMMGGGGLKWSYRGDSRRIPRCPWRREGSVLLRILWKNLNGDASETFRTRVAEGATIQEKVISSSDADYMWNTLARIIKNAVKQNHRIGPNPHRSLERPRGQGLLSITLSQSFME
uniref:Endonuclease/exonuclease/phosphatase domain-containing protein n=1 Tax=Tanacetum cinerariifolium TaxID=118510 RepID=A0A6L2P3L7_TANCI|nr:hypothetical protein [Tanacetum cinerariifolium]